MKVVALVLGILLGVTLIQAVVWIPIVRSWRRKRAASSAQLHADMLASGERTVRGPDRASYRGGTGTFSNVKGTGELLLTDRRVVFLKTTGGVIEVDRAAITGTRRTASFNGARVAGMTVLVLQLGGAEVGFAVSDADAWEAALARTPH